MERIIDEREKKKRRKARCSLDRHEDAKRQRGMKNNQRKANWLVGGSKKKRFILVLLS